MRKVIYPESNETQLKRLKQLQENTGKQGIAAYRLHLPCHKLVAGLVLRH